MSGGWAGSNRRAELPPDWSARRRAVLERDGYRCTQLDSEDRRCTSEADDVDHLGDRHDHRLEMLAAKCEWHHDRKTAAQGNAARRRFTTRRPREPHPGLVR